MTEGNTIIINPEAFGIIPAMINPDLDTPIWQQVHDGYAHGGGWQDFHEFAVLQGGEQQHYKIQYPGDPSLEEIGRIQIGFEMLIIFPSSWVLWQNLVDGETKIARID